MSNFGTAHGMAGTGFVAQVAALSLVASQVVGLTGPSGGAGLAPAARGDRPVAVHAVAGRVVPVPAMPAARPAAASWPAAGTSIAVLTTDRTTAAAGSVRAGNLPVWVGPPASAPSAGADMSRVQVTMAGHETAMALGVRGVVLTVARADGSPETARVHVTVDYQGFIDAFGGDYASRLRLVELPACALTTPQVARCRQQAPVLAGAANDLRAARVSADVDLPAATGASSVLAVTTAVSGSAGNYAALPLSEATRWVNGGSSGAYRYSYPMPTPPVPGDLQPKVGLDYDSQTTDGLTSSTNNQASWVGEGWDYSPGYVEADYETCSTAGGLNPNTGDLCVSSGQILTMSFNGNTSTLVCSSSGCHAEADGGATVVKQTAIGTGQSYWKMTDPEGTQYFFGLNQLPGYTSGDQTTNSAWTVPVWAGRYTPAVWRWNLDYVVDMHGNAIAYFYDTQTNYYAENNGTTGTAAYIQGGVLSKIEYGLRAGNLYSQTPDAQVNFTVSTSRQDAPDDLACATGAACSVTSPTFWTDHALTGVSTQALVGGTLQTVDSWALSTIYPDPGDSSTSPALWPASVTRTGQAGATPLTLPPTSFAGTPMANRISTAADRAAGYSPITRFRLTGVTNDTGGVTTIAYSGVDASCTAGSFPAIDANATTCYPDYWLPAGGSSLVQDWFTLYPVRTVTEADTTAADPPVVTSFSYTGAAWHSDDDTVSRSATTTWDQWRGYRTVTTQTGTPPDPVTQTVDTYLQGKSGDKRGCSIAFPPCDTTVTITSSRGDTITDTDPLAGVLFESIVYNGAGTGNQVTDTIHVPTGTRTATDSTLGISAYMVEDTGTKTYTTLAGGGARLSTTAYTYDSSGRTTQEIDSPDTSDTAQSTCTRTTYANDATNHVLTMPATVTVLATGSASACTAGSAPQAVSSTTYTYDSAFNTTRTQKAITDHFDPFTGHSFTYTSQTATYDQYGRVLTTTDADNRTTTTAYTPATGAEPTSIQVTDPVGLAKTTTYDPARNLALTVTDPAGYQTTTAYDALGRVTAKWTPGNPASGPAVNTYTYTVSNTAPSVITEQVEQPGGGYLTTQTVSDSLGQIREVQQETASGGTEVTETTYNSDRWKALLSDPYFVTGAPTGTLLTAASSAVPSQTGFVYDGDGRVIREIAYALGVETWETDTTYGGNYTTVVPPAGGTTVTTFTDGRNRTSAIYQYHAGVPASPADPPADYDKTTYTNTPAGKLAGITDAAGNTWSYTYDLLANQLTARTPDTGTTTSGYDNAGQLVWATDARGRQVSYIYDADGRRTAAYDTTGGAPTSTANQLASWTYDTLARGKPTSSTAFSGGSAYTQQITGYNTFGLATGSATVIPSAQGALAGTYTQQYTYAPTGQLMSYTDSTAGGLPTETVTIGHDSAGRPTSLTGASTYVSALSYTNLEQPLQYQLGTTAAPASITNSYDPQTGRLTEQSTQTGTAHTTVGDLHYAYDPSGNITSEADTTNGATDVQCFQYDYLARLTQAWAQGATGCASTPSAGAEGGPAPYWNTYHYNTIDDLTGITATTSTGSATTTTNTYPAPGAARPHAVSATTSGTTNTSYAYDAAGNLTTVTAPTQGQTLTWNSTGKLTQVAITPTGGTARNTGYTYTADGTLLLTGDPGTTTLYLPDEELSLNTTTSTVTGTRYYALGDVVVAARTGATSVAYLAGNRQGTDTLAIDAATLTAARRYYDPYGNPRGTAAGPFPTGQKGFVGGVNDTATNLTNLGAREYQPGLTSFISTDPLLKPYDPKDLNPYAYSEGNPTTYSDPTGTVIPISGGGDCEAANSGCHKYKYYDPDNGCRSDNAKRFADCVESASRSSDKGCGLFSNPGCFFAAGLASAGAAAVCVGLMGAFAATCTGIAVGVFNMTSYILNTKHPTLKGVLIKFAIGFGEGVLLQTFVVGLFKVLARGLTAMGIAPAWAARLDSAANAAARGAKHRGQTLLDWINHWFS